MYTASIYFMGRYRPAYFEAATAVDAYRAAKRAVMGCDDRAWFYVRLGEAFEKVRGNCTSFSTDHGCRGISLVARKHDPFLDSVTRDLPAYPGLDYTGAVNV